uniref:Uncharacterized protein n=1 Tax=Chromera velia CCMP2878 TaxID=1169474 RepID=A0A0G4I2V0_9ALVE|eukprot:Cvel_10508.t1-p1 / transcript=Cvel_10508.t1 / gene=Cvel_10508 / organism=Chromera_velia_CCMP2878 / gene_product=hypothetical protein / transcript_product=hypothetical protein / location=Cvel_scaffold635:60613-61743(+) / protein_length=377 / sequence_SO=supercontig / SO=protein_coding / is_pseudo=false
MRKLSPTTFLSIVISISTLLILFVPGFFFSLETIETETEGLNEQYPKKGPRRHVCEAYNSVIHVSGWDIAGLNDRLHIFRKMSRLAACLCARLRVPPPCRMLDRAHNSNKEISCTNRWSEILDFRFSDGVRVFADEGDVESRMPSWFVPRLFRSTETFSEVIRSKRVSQAFQQALQIRDARASFYWDFQNNWWFVEESEAFREVLEPECAFSDSVGDRIVEELDTALTQNVTARVFDSLGERPFSPNVATLWIRRGDRLHDPQNCTSHVEAVRDYVSRCTEPERSKIVVFTDETDPQYIVDLHKVLTDLNRTTIFGDRLVRSSVDSDVLERWGNYAVFFMGHQVMNKVGIALKIHTIICKPCDILGPGTILGYDLFR